MQENILFYKNFFDLSQTISSDIFNEIYYPWEVLPLIKNYIIKKGKQLSPSDFEEVEENLWISKKAKVCSSASISGPTIIDEYAEIRHCAFIRGGVIIGKNCVVGNSTEVKNAILFNNVQIPHFNYVGDSLLGYRSHLGAGAILSNVRSDKSNISIKLNDKKINTELRKFGAIIGDSVEIGCNSVLNPGTIIGKNSIIYPTSMIRGIVEKNTICKNSGELIKKN